MILSFVHLYSFLFFEFLACFSFLSASVFFIFFKENIKTEVKMRKNPEESQFYALIPCDSCTLEVERRFHNRSTKVQMDIDIVQGGLVIDGSGFYRFYFPLFFFSYIFVYTFICLNLFVCFLVFLFIYSLFSICFFFFFFFFFYSFRILQILFAQL